MIANHIPARQLLRFFCLTMLFSWVVADASAQKVTISNNLLYDAWLTPNLRVGYRLSPHWSAGLTAGYRPWPASDVETRKWRHLLLSPEVRYWKDSVDVHHFFGANLIYSHYNVGGVTFPFGLYKSVRNERREGDLIALGAFYGYSWPLGRRWNLEAAIGVALGYTSYKRFECVHCGKLLGKDNTLFAMPQAALNIVYNIPARPPKPLEPTVVTPLAADTIATTAVINDAIGLLSTDCGDCHHEALRLLLGVRHDLRSLNALGVAYWLCGQQREAQECFRQAAARGDADAKENLRRVKNRLTP